MSAPTPDKVPSPLYPCASEGCREHQTFSAEDLIWHFGSECVPSGFYCVICWDEQPDLCLVDDQPGPSLAECLASPPTSV